MAKSGKQDESAPKEKTTTEKLRDVIVTHNAAHAALESAKEARDAMFSEVAQGLIEKHGGAPVAIDGVTYSPKKSSTRKVDGVSVVPRYPYTLVTKHDKAAVSLD